MAISQEPLPDTDENEGRDAARRLRHRAPSRTTSLTSVNAEQRPKISLDIEETGETEVVTRPGLACRFQVRNSLKRKLS